VESSPVASSFVGSCYPTGQAPKLLSTKGGFNMGIRRIDRPKLPARNALNGTKMLRKNSAVPPPRKLGAVISVESTLRALEAPSRGQERTLKQQTPTPADSDLTRGRVESGDLTGWARWRSPPSPWSSPWA
jgi:hypothetical protein